MNLSLFLYRSLMMSCWVAGFSWRYWCDVQLCGCWRRRENQLERVPDHDQPSTASPTWEASPVRPGQETTQGEGGCQQWSCDQWWPCSVCPQDHGRGQQWHGVQQLCRGLLELHCAWDSYINDHQLHMHHYSLFTIAKNCLKNDKMKQIFPLTNKKHLMNTRLKEKFKVNKANTERYRKSAIPYMQNLLNTESKMIAKVLK